MRTLTVLASVLTLSTIVAVAAPPPPPPPAGGAGKPRPATVLYAVKPNAPAPAQAALAAVLKKYDVKGVRKLVKGRVEQARAHAAKRPTEDALCQELLATGAVAFAEPDRLLPPIGTVPNDPVYANQWHHPKIGSPAAWDVTTGSELVTVAVLDTGVQADHPDLAANLQLPGRNTVDNSTNTSPVHPHGTMTAGCVGAVGNNATGVAGVAWTIAILPVRVSNLADGSAYLSDMAEGITWAADQGAKVANLSYGGANSATIDTAAKYLRGRGGLLVMAAGNDGLNQRKYPDFASFLAVGATDPNDVKASWSTYGTVVDVVAPGVNITTTTTGSGYATVNGTSFAAPITAGVAALIYALKPDFTPLTVESLIFSTCQDLGAAGDDVVYGRGRVNAGAAVAAASAAANSLPPVASLAAGPTSGPAPLAVTFDGGGSSDPDGTIAAYAWSFGDGTSGSGATIVHTYSAAGTYTARLVVTDDTGLTAEATQVITVTGKGKPGR